MSAMPLSSTPAPAAAASPPRRHRRIRESQLGQPYVAGQYDALLGVIHRPDQAEIRGAGVELSASGQSVILTEMLRSGEAPRRIVAPADFPIYETIQIDEWRSVEIEIRLLEVPLEDRSDWERFRADTAAGGSGKAGKTGKKRRQAEKRRRKLQSACLYEYVSSAAEEREEYEEREERGERG